MYIYISNISIGKQPKSPAEPPTCTLNIHSARCARGALLTAWRFDVFVQIPMAMKFMGV